MTTNPNSMTFSAINYTKSAAKQELTFFWRTPPPWVETGLNAPGMDVVSKKKVVTCV